MAQVVLEHLTRRFAEKSDHATLAVNDLSLSVADGEFMVLVGPSGCGKSTTLRMIAGLEEISGGTVAIDGRIVNDVLPKDRDIAMVFQNYALYPHMTVYENLAFGLKLRKFPRADIAARVREAAALLGLEALLDRRPKALSGGQRQRVALGRAIVRQPKVFLFDEPLSNLDAKMRVAMRGEISRLHQRLGATMIYVTHDQIEAMTMGHRICVMKDGRVMQIAEPLELYRQPANLFVAGFIGSPPMNLFRGALSAQGGRLHFVEENARGQSVALALPDSLARRARDRLGQPIVFGIRPENVRVGVPPVPGQSSEAGVELTEPMGAETHLHLQTGATAFIARVASTEHFVPGQSVTIGFDVEHMRLFDAVTEQALV